MVLKVDKKVTSEVAQQWGLHYGGSKARCYALFQQGYSPADLIHMGIGKRIKASTIYQYHSLWQKHFKRYNKGEVRYE